MHVNVTSPQFAQLPAPPVKTMISYKRLMQLPMCPVLFQHASSCANSHYPPAVCCDQCALDTVERRRQQYPHMQQAGWSPPSPAVWWHLSLGILMCVCRSCQMMKGQSIAFLPTHQSSSAHVPVMHQPFHHHTCMMCMCVWQEHHITQQTN